MPSTTLPSSIFKTNFMPIWLGRERWLLLVLMIWTRSPLEILATRYVAWRSIFLPPCETHSFSDDCIGSTPNRYQIRAFEQDSRVHWSRDDDSFQSSFPFFRSFPEQVVAHLELSTHRRTSISLDTFTLSRTRLSTLSSMTLLVKFSQCLPSYGFLLSPTSACALLTV